MLSYPVSPKGVFKVRKITNFLSKISYSESEPDFPNFVVNSLSIFALFFLNLNLNLNLMTLGLILVQCL